MTLPCTPAPDTLPPTPRYPSLGAGQLPPAAPLSPGAFPKEKDK